ncbi:MAG: DMT family transporter [Gammaproteobacteria bacterium]|nr:DMT family transporter [Gammaproteobacteria bacterium]
MKFPRPGGQWAFPLLLLGATAIGFAPIFVRLADTGPVTTAFYRMALALPLLGAWLALESAGPVRRMPAGLGDYLLLALAGVFFAADLGAWHASIIWTSVANATLLANCAPVFVVLGGWLLFGWRVSRLFLAGMLLAFTGSVVLMGESLSLGGTSLLGDGLGLLTAVFYGGYLLSISRLRERFSTATIMTVSGVVTCLLLAPAAWLLEDRWLAASLSGWMMLLALAWFSHTLGQSAIAWAMAHLSAALSSVSLLLQPVVAAFLAWWWLGESVRPWQWAGGVVVLAGIYLARLASSRPGVGR